MAPKQSAGTQLTNPLSKEEAARAPTRKMSVIAQDPGVRRDNKIVMSTIDVPAEDLRVGPMGYRVQVVDFDATRRVFHGSHDLPASFGKEPKSWREGRPAVLRDFRFHAQNAYALVMKTLARFEFALGRRIPWAFKTSHQLKVAPHGMADANAFYSPEVEGLVFGYFDGMSGEKVFTCLSHDIIVHETTHALLDGLRERYMDPSTPDQAAFHEGFSDVVALLSVFAQPEVVEHLLIGKRRQRVTELFVTRRELAPDALASSALFGLADQMGAELEGVRGQPLRQSAALKADPKLKDTDEFKEPHRRGELFVAAVMQGFIKAWSHYALGAGLGGQKRFPVRRVAQDGADIADLLATMWIRAVDYMPPVHLEFGDALSAALTADFEVRPDDLRYELRKHMRDSFKAFGFAPASDRTDGTGMWRQPPPGLKYDRVRFEALKTDKDEVFRFIWDNREPKLLNLRDGAYTQVLSVQPSTRIGVDGFVVRETVAQYYQVARLTPDEIREVGVNAPREYLRSLADTTKAMTKEAATNGDDQGEAADVDEIEAKTTPLYGGGVLIFDEYGRVKYFVENDVFGKKQNVRLEYLWKEGLLEPGEKSAKSARLRATRLSTLHRLRALRPDTSRVQGW
jgi:hypothetical protein